MRLYYANQLEGKLLGGDWKVREKIALPDDHTGSTFSVGYLVEDSSGSRAFCKALDFSAAMGSPDDLLGLLKAYIFERDLYISCRDRRMDHILLVLDHGSIQLNPAESSSVVHYLIFELADGDIRKHLRVSKGLDVAWRLRSIHEIAVGLQQLHGAEIAHQDLKPSNVMVFDSLTSKLGDLGRASVNGGGAQRHDVFQIAGDPSYAPPELIYGFVSPDWRVRRVACDLYHLGSMIAFIFGGASLTAMWLAELPREMQPDRYTGTYEDALPFARDAISKAIARLEATFPEAERADLVELVRYLSEPEPSRRGHPLDHAGTGDRYSLQRIVTRLDFLAKRASGSVRAL